MNLDAPCLCPHCRQPMQLMVPIWITPGVDELDIANVFWESDAHKDDANWWCETCQSHHFPMDQEEQLPEGSKVE